MNIPITILIIILLYIIYKSGYLHRFKLVHNIDNFLNKKKICDKTKCFIVSGKYENDEEAFLLLSKVNDFCIELLRHLKNKYTESNTKAGDSVRFLLNNYNQDNIVENTPYNDINTSFVENKGSKIAICLREKKTGKNLLHDIEDLKFVVIHELAHLMIKPYDHGNEFWEHFKFLLEESLFIDYNPKDYSKGTINYCGVHVDYNPYYDKTLNIDYLFKNS